MEMFKDEFEGPNSSEKKRFNSMDVSKEFIEEYVRMLRSSQKPERKIVLKKRKKKSSSKQSPEKVEQWQ